MDVAEANKFINALVKNLQVLCHGHVNFNNSIQVIGHLYLNVDSDTNIDYIVNEKVCKSDSSSTVFVSKSYHSEPKTPLKATQVDKRTEQNVIPVSLPSLSQPISNRRPVPLRITSKNIHPAYRDDRPTFESPAKIPKLSLVGEFKASRTSTPIQPKSKGGAEIDMCIVKQEPGMEREREDLQSPDHSNVPGPSFERLSDDFNPNDQSYSNSIPIALHGNNSNIDTVFSQSLDTSTSTAPPSQFGPIDGSSLDDNLKVFFGSKNNFDSSQQISVKRETYDTLIDIVLGRLRKLPQRERTNVQKAAFVRFYRGGKERWTVQENEFGENRLYYDNVECRFY